MAMNRQLVTLTTPQQTVLRREAEALGITPSELIRRIVDDWRADLPPAAEPQPKAAPKRPGATGR